MATGETIPFGNGCGVAELVNEPADVLTASVTNPALIYIRAHIHRQLVFVVLTERTIKQSFITRSSVFAQAGRNYL
jgi:hypothetical protein